jgi:predicted nuclease of predicted toxin-antitoxin system
MKFLVDECTGPSVASCWILITNDKDFGDKVFRNGRLHKGVILLRLENERAESKIQVLSHLLKKYSNRLPNEFVVVTEKQVRFAKR